MLNALEPSNNNFHGNSNSIDMFDSFDILESPETVAQLVPPLVGFLKRFDRDITVSKLASYAMNQGNHRHIMRLDILIRLAMIYCVGSTTPRLEDLKKILNRYIRRKDIQKLEDNPMYPYAETFLGQFQDVLLLNGSLCPAVKTAQYAYDALLSLGGPKFKECIDKVDNFIRFIKLFNEQRNFTVDYGSPLRKKDFVDARFVKKVNVSKRCLQENGISVSDLVPFCFNDSLTSSESSPNTKFNFLEHTPLIETENDIIVAAPHSLALSIKNFILSSVSAEMQTEEFQSALADVEQTEMSRHKFPELVNSTTEYLFNWRVERSSRCIGNGRYVLAYHIIEPVVNARTIDSDRYQEGSDRIVTTVRSQIDDFVKERSVEPDYQHTQTLVTTSSNQLRLRMCDEYNGVGDYTVFSLHPEDIAICSRVFDLTIYDLWRYGKILTDLSRDGLELRNIGTFINLITFLVQYSNQLSQSEKDQYSRLNLIDIGSEFEKQVRDQNVTDRNLRSRSLPNKERVGTECFANTPTKTFDQSQFTALDHDRGLVGVCSDYTTLWLESGKPVSSLSKFEWFVWNTLHGMLTYLGKAENLGGVRSINADPVLVKLKFSHEISTETRRSMEPEKIFHISTETSTRTIEVVVNVEWYSNYGHQRVGWSAQIVKDFMDCLIQLDPLREPERKAIATMVDRIENDDFEYGSTSDATDYPDYMIGEGVYEPRIPIKPSARYLNRVNRKKRIYGDEDYTKFENKQLLFDYCTHCLDELTSRIRHLNKERLLHLCLRQHYNAILEERRWYHSSPPKDIVLGKEAMKHDYNNAYRRTASVMRATTIIIEISIHDAGKLGSEEIGLMEFEELMALALELFKVQTDTDVEKYRPEDIEMHYGFDGAINLDNKLNQDSYPIINDQIMKPVEDHVDRLEQEKEEWQRSKSGIENDKRLEEAFVCEYGIPISKMGSFLNSITDIAVESKVRHFRMKKSALRSVMCQGKEFSEDEVNNLTQRLTIKTRKTFKAIDDGLHDRELLFSRFSRGQSLISRPIVILNDGKDPEYFISPLLVHRSLRHSLNGATEGSLNSQDYFVSESMKRYTSRASDEKGKEFNSEVAKIVEQVGFEVDCEVKMTKALRLKSSDEIRRLGSVDILAIDRENSKVWVLEAKNLKFCHTTGEVASLLSDYSGGTIPTSKNKLKPDRLKRHLDRVEFLQRHRERLAETYSLDSDFEIEGRLVISLPQVLGNREWEIGTDQESVTIDKLQDYLKNRSTKSAKD